MQRKKTPHQPRRKLALKMHILILILLPWIAVWFGMYYLHSLLATFALYHAVCMLPAIVIKRKLWRENLTRPSVRQIALLGGAVLVSSAVAAAIYLLSGDAIISGATALRSLEQRGFRPDWFLPMSAYFLTINPIFKELFWRGVIYNELKNNDASNIEEQKNACSGSSEEHRKVRFFKCELYTAIGFAAWHYVPLSTLLATPWTVLVLLGIAAAGYLLARLYEQNRSLTLPILWHALVLDLPLIIILFLMLSTHNAV